MTYNCNNLINQTIKSVLKLPYDNIEYIIVDGGSTDGTLNKIKKYNNLCDFWISKKDNGIYHAMFLDQNMLLVMQFFFLMLEMY